MTIARTIVITGANAGIGLRAASTLAAAGHHVIAVARDPQRGAAAVERISSATGNPRVDHEPADLSDLGSLHALSTRLHDRIDHVDVLINNAAVFDLTATRELTAEGHERFWATNHLGPYLLTALLSDLLLTRGGRLITIASKGLVTTPRIEIRYDGLDASGWFTPTRAYYHSKLAQVMFAGALAQRYSTDELLSVALRVPAVRLDPERLSAMPARLRWAYAPKNRLAADPAGLGEVYARLAVGLEHDIAALHGGYVDERLRPVAMPRAARSVAEQEKLWSLSSAATAHPTWAPSKRIGVSGP